MNVYVSETDMTAFSDHLNQCGECKFFGPCAYLKEHNGGICDNPNSDHFDHYITFTHVACSRFNAPDSQPARKTASRPFPGPHLIGYTLLILV